MAIIVNGTTGSPRLGADEEVTVTGRVLVTFDPLDGAFQDGDILVTGMTTPDYVSLYSRAAAVVTDGGSILCHAAIVAREYGIPAVVATQNATTQLLNGGVATVTVSRQGGTVTQE
jgi:phosphoenolpyruvate synthase/pyruvate phosphate dikinase